MIYKEMMSNTEDVVWLAYQLKNKLGNKISINKFGLYKEVLEGIYKLDGYNRGIDFSILYNDKNFLIVNVGEVYISARYEDKLFVLNNIKNAIKNIVRDGVSLGEPSVFYNIRDEKYKVPCLDYVYTDKENVIKAFQDKTIFDDGTVPEDVIIFDNLNEGKTISQGRNYSYIDEKTGNKYTIYIYALVKNKSNVEEERLVNIIKDNFDDLFNNNNLLGEYVHNGNDIVYVVSYIKDALSLNLTSELDLEIMIYKDDDCIHDISYINEHLVKYISVSKLFEYSLNTNYSIKTGINFFSNCALEASDIIEKGVNLELNNINSLRKINVRADVKPNNNLIKLVKRIGNK